jgi:hypothetical protein
MLMLSDELRALARLMDEQAKIAGGIAKLMRLLSDRAQVMEREAAARPPALHAPTLNLGLDDNGARN